MNPASCTNCWYGRALGYGTHAYGCPVPHPGSYGLTGSVHVSSVRGEMSSAIVSLIIAVVGVSGTLASAVLTQRSSLRARREELAHTERVRRAEQEDAEEKRRTERLRDCYVRLNANDRNYRDALLAYAYALKAGLPGEAESAEVAAARRAQRDARAEAQMVVSDQVLDAEGEVNRQLTRAYSSLKRIEREGDVSVRANQLDKAIERLDRIISMMSRVRVLMRRELGITDVREAKSEHHPAELS